MTKKKNLAVKFNVALIFVCLISVIILTAGLFIGTKTTEHQGWDGLGAGILLALSLYAGVFVCVVGGVLAIVTAVLFSTDKKKGKDGLSKYILSTISKSVWTAYYIWTAVMTISVSSYGVVLGVMAILFALVNILACVFDWLSKKEDVPEIISND